MISRLKDQLESDKAIGLAWVTMRDPQMVAAIAQQPFGAVLLDCVRSGNGSGPVGGCPSHESWIVTRSDVARDTTLVKLELTN